MNPIAHVSINGDDDQVVVAHVSGEIDLASAPGVGEELAGAVPNRALGLVVDLERTTYLDSSGISLIFDLAERLRRRQQQLRLVVSESSPLRRVLGIVDAGGAVPILSSVEEAAAQIRSAA
jgi:anti-anti-sigma factor